MGHPASSNGVRGKHTISSRQQELRLRLIMVRSRHNEHSPIEMTCRQRNGNIVRIIIGRHQDALRLLNPCRAQQIIARGISLLDQVAPFDSDADITLLRWP